MAGPARTIGAGRPPPYIPIRRLSSARRGATSSAGGGGRGGGARAAFLTALASAEVAVRVVEGVGVGGRALDAVFRAREVVVPGGAAHGAGDAAPGPLPAQLGGEGGAGGGGVL